MNQSLADNNCEQIFKHLISFLTTQIADYDQQAQQIIQELLILDKMKNRTLQTKKEQQKTYLQSSHQVQKQEAAPIVDNLAKIEENIEAALHTAQLQLKEEVQGKPKVNPPTANIYDDYEPPKKVKPTLEPYKQQVRFLRFNLEKLQKKSGKGKAPPPPQKQKIAYPPPKRLTSMQRNPEKIGNQPRASSQSKSSTSSAKQIQEQSTQPTRLQSSKPPQSSVPQHQQYSQSTAMHEESSPILTKNKSQIIVPESRILEIQHVVKEEKQQKQEKQERQEKHDRQEKPPQILQTFQSTDYAALVELINGKDTHSAFQLKKERDQLVGEYYRNVKYFKEKETKARMRFLSKLISHGQEKKNVLTEKYIGWKQEAQSEGEEARQYYETKQTEPIIQLNAQLTEHAKMNHRLIEYLKHVHHHLSQFQDKFDPKLLQLLRKQNANTIGSLSVKDLVEIFRVWNQIQIFHDCFSSVQNQKGRLIQMESDLGKPIQKFLTQFKQQKEKQNLGKPLALSSTKKIISEIKFNIGKQITIDIVKTDATGSEEDFININMRHIENLVTNVIYNNIAPVVLTDIRDLTRNTPSVKRMEQIMKRFQILLTFVFFQGRIHVSIFPADDVLRFN